MSLINAEYQQQLMTMHQQGQFQRGSKIFDQIQPIIEQYQPQSVLDFGCGQGGLMRALAQAYPLMRVQGYDPGSATHNVWPRKPVDMIVSADVFEHIEPEHVDRTLKQIGSRMRRAGWFRIACYPAKKSLPDGRNAHLIVEPPAWWRERVISNMPVRIMQEWITTVDKSHKWPLVRGENYDLVVEVI